MTLKEKARAKVNELDKRMAELNTLFENETDSEKKDELAKEILSVGRIAVVPSGMIPTPSLISYFAISQ